MKTPTSEVQIIKQGGQPAFAVVPYDLWLEITGQKSEGSYIPHEVVGIKLKDDCSLLKAWRKYKQLTQKELSEKAGITQAALSQLEKQESKMQEKTIEKLANALGISKSQLVYK